MAEYVAEYGALKGARIEYKDSLTWLEFGRVTRVAKTSNNDVMTLNDELIKLALTKITDPNGQEYTEQLMILKEFGNLDVRDAKKVLGQASKLVEADDDPKET